MRNPVLVLLCVLACVTKAAGQEPQRVQLDAIDGMARAYFPGFDPGAPVSPTQRLVTSQKRHILDVGGRTLSFTAELGAVDIENQQGVLQAQVAYVAYIRDAKPGETRPVTFAMNGGPGYFSAILHLGGLGPWRLPMTQTGDAMPVGGGIVPNAETWLDFTDLVFIDAVTTGFSRYHRRDHSIDALLSWHEGDVAALAHVTRSWMKSHERSASPMVFLGQSYSGMRGCYLAGMLGSMPGQKLNGLVLVSPAFYTSLGEDKDDAGLMPSVLAQRTERRGTFKLEDLATYERFAWESYLPGREALRRDKSDSAGLALKIAAVTGLPLDWTKEQILLPQISARSFLRDPPPTNDDGMGMPTWRDDPLTALQKAVSGIVKEVFGAEVGVDYEVMGHTVYRGKVDPLAVLAGALSRDDSLRVLIGQGALDMTTPYFRNRVLLQGSALAADRIGFKVYGGGHTFYYRDAPRRAFRDDALEFYGTLRPLQLVP